MIRSDQNLHRISSLHKKPTKNSMFITMPMPPGLWQQKNIENLIGHRSCFDNFSQNVGIFMDQTKKNVQNSRIPRVFVVDTNGSWRSCFMLCPNWRDPQPQTASLILSESKNIKFQRPQCLLVFQKKHLQRCPSLTQNNSWMFQKYQLHEKIEIFWGWEVLQ